MVKNLVVTLVFFLSGGPMQLSHAGSLNTMNDSSADKISYHVRVLDEDGRPLIGAALWWSNVDEGDPLDWKAVMNRLADRFAADYDYACP